MEKKSVCRFSLVRATVVLFSVCFIITLFASCAIGNDDGANGAVTSGADSSQLAVSSEPEETTSPESGGDVDDNDDIGIGGISGASLALLSSVSVVSVRESPDEDTAPYSISSGVILDIDRDAGDAYIITNMHAVYDRNSESGVCRGLYIYLYGAYFPSAAYAPLTGIPAKFVGGSAEYDIAVLKVTASRAVMSSDALALEHADSDDVTPGEALMIVGNAKSSGISLTKGVVSVQSEYIYSSAISDFPAVRRRLIRTDAAINPGNSGGGAFDEEGRLVGVVIARSADDDTFGFGYLIPSNIAVFVAENIIDTCDGKTSTVPLVAKIGISLAALETHAIYDEEDGVVRIIEKVSVYSVNSDSAASGILSVGDIVTAIGINGNIYDIDYSYEAIDLIITCRAGDTLTLYAEDPDTGEERTFTIVLTQNDLVARA